MTAQAVGEKLGILALCLLGYGNALILPFWATMLYTAGMLGVLVWYYKVWKPRQANRAQ